MRVGGWGHWHTCKIGETQSEKEAHFGGWNSVCGCTSSRAHYAKGDAHTKWNGKRHTNEVCQGLRGEL